MSKFKWLDSYSGWMTKLCLSLLVIFLYSCQGNLPTKTVPSQTNVPKEPVTVAISKIPEAWLKPRRNPSEERKAPKWVKQVALGDQATQRKQWLNAAQYYNKALDLIDSPMDTPQPPPHAKIKSLYKCFETAQLIADTLVPPSPTRRSIEQPQECSSTMRSQVRGVQMTEHLKAIQFEFAKTTFTQKGALAAQQLAACLKGYNFSGTRQIKLIGHTDKKGSRQYNHFLSIRRANAFKTYLQNQGVSALITADGRGEDEPVHLNNSEDFTEATIDALNRRVEIVTY
jgi:outer membrane protein OmpA-like peptidoglycan-associated protein